MTIATWYSHSTQRTNLRGHVTLREGRAIPSDAFWSRIQRDRRLDTTPGYVCVDGRTIPVTDPHPEGK